MSSSYTAVQRSNRARLTKASLLLAVLAALALVLTAYVGLFSERPEVVLDYEGFRHYAWVLASVVLAVAFVISLRRSQKFKRLNDQLTALYRISQIASSALEPDKIVHEVVEATRAIMGYSYVTVMMIQEDRLVPMAWTGYATRPPELTLETGIKGRVARIGEPALVGEVSLDPDYALGVIDTVSEIACPIAVDGRVVGVLSVETVKGRLMREDLELVKSLTLQLGLALRNATQYRRVREQSIRDSLTGLYNHAHFQERLREELARARRYEQPLALIMADLDHFKSLNDTRGHIGGDRVLRRFAEVIQRGLRRTDLAARYGGDEFAIILPDTRREQAEMIVERFCRQLDQRPPLGGEQIAITASFGLATFPEDTDDPVDLIRRADEALYSAKKKGKTA